MLETKNVFCEKSEKNNSWSNKMKYNYIDDIISNIES